MSATNDTAATKPEATDGDWELALYQELSALSDEAVRRFHGPPEEYAAAKDLIASHVAARLAPLEARLAAVASDRDKWMEVAEVRGRILAAVEAERDALFKINGDLARLLDVEKQAESERDALKRLLTDSVCRIQETDGESLLVKRIMEAL